MASLSPSLPLAFSSAPTTSFGLFYHKNKNPSSWFQRRKLANVKSTPGVVCSGSNGGNSEENDLVWPAKFDRRDALIGLGGLYGASTFGSDPFAFAAPIDAPVPSKCKLTTDPPGMDCCPTPNDNVKDFIPQQPRVRKAAQSLSQAELEKYKKAVEAMKALPDDDPLSFTQQANVHCAYCNGGYEQLGFPVEFQVHNSWLFFPFHRYYLYFHERILGSLINDPTFALPFWNYDAPEGMVIPKIYTDKTSPLYDPRRNQLHQPPTLVDLDYNNVEPTLDLDAQIQSNLAIMHRQVVSGARTPLLFFGQPYRNGDKPNPGMGTVENLPHTPIHIWTGDPNQPDGMDMGTFYAAARDPIFYAHHSNVDRFWCIWKTLGGKRKDIQDPDFLNTSFIFYNENREPVRVYVKDCLDTKNLGYVYDSVPLPWLDTRRTPRKTLKPKKQSSGGSKKKPRKGKFPLSLNKIVSIEVQRPKRSRSKREKDDEEEVLVIDRIQFNPRLPLKFDVFINDEDDKEIRADNTEFAGSFVTLPHAHGNKMTIKTCLKLGITELLEDMDADDDDSVVVTLVPRFGDGITIGDISIKCEG